MKKGFTLLELLAVIVILGILVFLAIPKVSEIMQTAKIKVYKNNQEVVIKSIKDYLVLNEDKLPKEIGETIEISFEQLQDENYMNTITDDQGICNGYVLITKNKTDFEYIPHINCGETNDLTSSAEDNLILHYSFNDFSESTENIYKNGDYDLVPQFHNLSTQTTYEIENIAKPEFVLSNNLMKSSGTIETNPYCGSDVTIEGGEEYTVSLWVWVSPNFTGNKVELSISRTTGSIFGTDLYDLNNKGTWQKLTRTGYTTLGEEYLRCLLELRSPESGYVLSDGLQIEQKSYNTPFEKDIRIDKIYDYSLNQSNEELPLANTPHWLEFKNNGFYSFNGENQYISLTNKEDFDLQGDFTISLWAKTDLDYPSETSNYKFKGIISKTDNGVIPGISYFIDWNGTSTTRTLRAGVGDGEEYFSANLYNFNFDSNWKQITMTKDSSYIILYVDGEEEKRQSHSLNGILITENELEIGRAFQSNNYIFEGELDEVQIYGRKLSSEEINLNYQLTKNNYEN